MIFELEETWGWEDTYLYSPLPAKYNYLKMVVTARTDHQAAKIALREIDLFRGALNFCFNSGNRTYTFSGRQMPMNKIACGPLHTLHNLDGSKFSELFWYEPTYISAIPVFNMRNRMNECKKSMRRIFGILSRYDKDSSLSNAFVRYARACDQFDYNTATIKLWSILELLTVGNGENHLEAIKRTSRIYSNSPVVLEVLKYLRQYRNHTVHTSEEEVGLQHIANQLRAFVEGLLLFHLNAIQHVSGVQGVREVLTLGLSEGNLTKQLSALKATKKIMFPRMKRAK